MTTFDFYALTGAVLGAAIFAAGVLGLPRRRPDPFALFVRRMNQFGADGCYGYFFIDAATADAVEGEALRMGLRVRFERRPGCRHVRVVLI